MTRGAVVLVDTGPVLRQLRSHQPTIRLLRQIGHRERLGISAITRLEVHAGMYRDERYETQKMLSRFETFEIDAGIADLAGDLIVRSRPRGVLSLPDAVIAATAQLKGLTLVTYNVAHFAHLRGLRLYSLPQED